MALSGMKNIDLTEKNIRILAAPFRFYLTQLFPKKLSLPPKNLRNGGREKVHWEQMG